MFYSFFNLQIHPAYHTKLHWIYFHTDWRKVFKWVADRWTEQKRPKPTWSIWSGFFLQFKRCCCRLNGVQFTTSFPSSFFPPKAFLRKTKVRSPQCLHYSGWKGIANCARGNQPAPIATPKSTPKHVPYRKPVRVYVNWCTLKKHTSCYHLVYWSAKVNKCWVIV